MGKALRSTTAEPIALDFYGALTTSVEHVRYNLVVGPPGCGKSVAAAWVAGAVARKLGAADAPPVVIQGTSNMEINTLWGQHGLKAGDTSFQDRGLSLALKSNRYVVLNDFMAIPPEVRSELLPSRDAESLTNPISGEELAIPKTWRLIATSLPEDMRCRGNAAVVKSLMDAFVVTEVPPISVEGIRRLLLNNHPHASEAVVDAVVEKFEQFRRIRSREREDDDGYELSVRAAEHLLCLVMAGMSMREACMKALVLKWSLDKNLLEAAKAKADMCL